MAQTAAMKLPEAAKRRETKWDGEGEEGGVSRKKLPILLPLSLSC